MITFSAKTIERVEIDAASTGSSERYGVVIFDNATNTVDEVVAVLIQATNCTVDEAVTETWEAHTYGRAWVHFSSEEECRKVADVIALIGVAAQVKKEWD